MTTPSHPLPDLAFSRPAQATRRWLAAGMLTVVAVVLSGCGGGGSAEPATETPAAMSGTVSNGVLMDATNFQGLDVGVKGLAGTARETSAVNITTRYSVTLAGLQPPYLLSATVLDGVRLIAPATTPGTANLTPLTTLSAAWLLGADPGTYFDDTLDGEGGVPAFTASQVEAAQAEVVRYLTRVTGVAVSDAVAASDWVTRPMTNQPGDAMFDQIVVLNTALANAGSSLSRLAAEVAAQRQRCNRHRLTVGDANGSYSFCQMDSTTAYADNNSEQIFSFTDIEGASLTLTVRNGAATQVIYATREGRFSCQGALACSGANVGTRGEDDTLPITLESLDLEGTSGAHVTLSGHLTGAGALPNVPCETDRLYLLPPAGEPSGLCMYQSGSNRRGALSEYGWGSLDNDQPYQLAIVGDGTTVSSVDLWWYAPDTGMPVSLYRCEGSACTGVTIGEPHDSVDSYGDPVRVRNFSLRNVPLRAVDAQGSLGADVAMHLTTVLVSPVPAAGFTPDCSQSVEHHHVVFGDGTPALDVCPPPPTSGDYESFKSAYPYGMPGFDDAVDFAVSTYVVPQDGSVAPLNTLHAIVSGTRVLKVLLQTTGDSRTFSCVEEACAGVTVSAQDDQGRRHIDFVGTVLVEDPVRQLPGTGVTATVTGGFLTLPDPYFVPLSAPAGGRPNGLRTSTH